MPIPARFRITKPTKKRIAMMKDLCDQIEQAIERGDDATPLLAQWHEQTNRTYETHEFQHYWRAISQDDFVKEALCPAPQRIGDLTFEEATEVAEMICTAKLTVAENSYFLNWLEEQFDGENISDLIFWPDAWFGDASLFRNPDGSFKPEAELTPAQIVLYVSRHSGRELLETPDDIPMPFPLPKRL